MRGTGTDKGILVGSWGRCVGGILVGSQGRYVGVVVCCGERRHCKGMCEW